MQYVSNATPGFAANTFGAGKHGFQDGDPTTGTRGTKLSAELFNDLLGNLMKVVEAGIGAGTPGDHDDLKDAIMSLAATRPLQFKSANYNIQASDNGTTIVFDTNGGALSTLLPDVTALPVGFNVELRCNGTNLLTVNRTGGQTIDGATSLVLGAKRSAAVFGDAATWYSSKTAAGVYAQGYQVITAPGTANFTVPAGVYELWVWVWGAGGGGGGGHPGPVVGRIGSDGGGGGGYSFKKIAVTPGQVISYTIGAGGTKGGVGPTNGTAGGSSSFGAYCSATGGAGGNWNSGAGSNAGTGTGGDINLPGIRGGGVQNITQWVLGGTGGGSPFGGAGGTWDNKGGAPGGGGGGAASGDGQANTGGDGADGMIIVRW